MDQQQTDVGRTPDAGGVPAPAPGFVGRSNELEAISGLLLGSARLVTLIGPGGIGKTRLAAEAVSRYRKATGVPAFWVPLARLPSGAGVSVVAEQVARCVLEADFSARPAWESLVDVLTRTDAVRRNLQTLLVVDNCEHVSASAAQVVGDLLTDVPGLRVLATARGPIGWVDEHRMTLRPLADADALALFRQRAELTGHPVPDGEADTASTICRHLHNHPLYLRLAAARLWHQPLAAVLRELSGGAGDRRLEWSPGPTIGADLRHRSIPDVIAWSYQLCPAPERLLLDRMSVFAAGYDPGDSDAGTLGVDADAVAAICGGPDLEPALIPGLLERLADRSLITAHRSANTVRYSLLESIRLFAVQRLAERSDTAAAELNRRHRRYYRDKVVYAQANWYSRAELELLEWARAEWDNLLLAIETSLDTPAEAVLSLEIATGLIALRTPFFRGTLRDARLWTERTLAATAAADPPPAQLRIAAQALTAWVALCQGDNVTADRTLNECVTALAGELPGWRESDADHGFPALLDYVWGAWLLLADGDPRALPVLRRAREKFAAQGDGGGGAMSELFEVLAAGFLGPAEYAHEAACRHLRNAEAAGASWAISWAQLALAITLTNFGDAGEALRVGRTALHTQWSVQDQWGATWAVHIRAWSLSRLITAGVPQSRAVALATEIAQLTAGGQAMRERLGVSYDGVVPFRDATAEALEVARGVLGAAGLQAAQRLDGQVLTGPDAVQRMALGLLPRKPVAAGRAGTTLWTELTAAERHVAFLAAAGLTNSAIAARRGSSTKTVDAQMTSVFQKLMISSRRNIPGFLPPEQVARLRAKGAGTPLSG